MNYFIKQYSALKTTKIRGFVLPFTLFICAIMILLSVSISAILTKQIYFSTIGRESQIAYYAADNAIACTLSVDETYVDEDGNGIFPFDSTQLPSDFRTSMENILASVNSLRTLMGATTLGDTLDDIKCAQSKIFSVAPDPTDFTVSATKFTRDLPLGGTEDGVTSSFMMKMDLQDGTFRCAKVTVNKTATYRQIIAQGFSRCDRPDGSIERAVVNTSIIQ